VATAHTKPQQQKLTRVKESSVIKFWAMMHSVGMLPEHQMHFRTVSLKKDEASQYCQTKQLHYFRKAEIAYLLHRSGKTTF
jgi:hypothetical protein